MNLQTNTHFIAKLDSKLSLLDKDSLKEIYKHPTPISSFFLTKNLLYFGSSLEIFSLNIFSLEINLLFSLNELATSLFVLDNNLLIGQEDGKILKYLIHEDEEDRVYSLIEEYKHSAPIISILYDGEDIVVSDLKNRLTLFPSKIQYDLRVTQILFKEYVFTSERNKLFCKTRQALGSILEVEGKIYEFRFNEKGSVVFIRLFDKIQIYEINIRFLIKEIPQAFDSFCYCDLSNRLIGWKGKEIEKIENVLEEEYPEMNIKFNKLEMDVRKVGIMEEEIGVEKKISKITDFFNVSKGLSKGGEGVNRDRPRDGVCKGGISKGDRLRDDYKEPKADFSKSDLSKGDSNHRPSSKKIKLKDRLKDRPVIEEVKIKPKTKLKNLFKEDEFSEEDDDERVEERDRLPSYYTPTHSQSNTIPLIQSNTTFSTPVFPIYSKGTSLLWYSKEGSLISLKSGRQTRVELKFHDSSIPGIQFEDKASCSQGVFFGKIIVLYSQDALYFYHNSLLWTKKCKPEKVCISEKYVVVYSKLIYFYSHTGEEIYNFHPRTVNTMSLIKNRLVLGCNNLMIIDDFKLKFTYELPGIPTWTCLDEDGNVYYRIEEDIYKLKDGLSHRIATKIKYPLVVVGDKLIYLKNKEKITPTPHLEYHEIK